MPKKDPPARLPRLRKEDISAEMTAIFELFSGSTDLNIEDNHVFNTLAHHPILGNRYLTFNHYLLNDSTLPVRLRQIAILRLSWLKKAVYQWSSHLRTSLRNGLQPSDFDAVKAGAEDPHWNPDERSVLRATDYLLQHATLNNNNWTALSGFLGTQQILDFLFTVGTYQLLGGVLNSLRVEREEELLLLAERFGAPTGLSD